MLIFVVIHCTVDFEGRAITIGDKEATADGGGVGGCERSMWSSYYVKCPRRTLSYLFLWVVLQSIPLYGP